MVAIAGGTASVLGGGKFANGAMSAAFVFMFNEMADYRLRQSKGRHNIADKASDRGLIRAGKSRALATVTKQDMATGFDHLAKVTGVASASLYATGQPHLGLGFATVSAFSTAAYTKLNDIPDIIDSANIANGAMIDLMMPPNLPGTIAGESLKIYIDNQ